MTQFVITALPQHWRQLLYNFLDSLAIVEKSLLYPSCLTREWDMTCGNTAHLRAASPPYQSQSVCPLIKIPSICCTSHQTLSNISTHGRNGAIFLHPWPSMIWLIWELISHTEWCILGQICPDGPIVPPSVQWVWRQTLSSATAEHSKLLLVHHWQEWYVLYVKPYWMMHLM
jgi:hypothetical protein